MLSISDIPENILLEIFRYLTIKDLCVICRVCRSWRRIANDKAVWKHVDMRSYKLNLQKMWKVIRAHFSDVLLSLHVRGYHVTGSANLMKTNLSEAMMLELKDRCPNIRELEIVENHFTQVPLKAFPSSLKVLRLRSCYISLGWFTQCNQHLPLLEVLELTDCKKTSDSDMKDVSNCKTLQVLQLDGCYRIGPSGLESIALSLSNLRELHISGVNCSDLALHHICRNLKLLKNLNASGTAERKSAVSSGSIAGSVTILSELEWLNLSHSSTTDETLLKLSTLKKLKWLGISFTSTTAKGIDNFKKDVRSKGGSADLEVIADHVQRNSDNDGSLESTLDYPN